jgi:shikimate kinase
MKAGYLKMEQNIILIGFMGSGKTSVGSQLAQKLNYSFDDTDQRIEREAKRDISRIFAEDGEEYFRRLETQLIQNLYSSMSKTILSTGGGLPIREENTELLRRLGQVIYLKTSKETILKRLDGDASRPLLAGEDRQVKVEKLLNQRAPIYEMTANHIIETDDKTVDEIIDEIYETIKDDSSIK